MPMVRRTQSCGDALGLQQLRTIWQRELFFDFQSAVARTCSVLRRRWTSRRGTMSMAVLELGSALRSDSLPPSSPLMVLCRCITVTITLLFCPTVLSRMLSLQTLRMQLSHFE